MANDAQKSAKLFLQRRIRQFSRLEKTFYGVTILTAIIMAVGIIYLQSRNLQVQQEISSLTSQINEKEEEYNNAKQEVNELSRREVIVKVAEEAGLTPKTENIKKVD